MLLVATGLLAQPIGTPHPTAVCLWCRAKLVVGEVCARRAWLCPFDWPRQVKHAIFVTPQDKKHAQLCGVPIGTKVCIDVPLPSQAEIEERIDRFAIEYPGKRLNLLWGGMAGPGKSHGIRFFLYRRSMKTPKHEALLLRENWEQLEKTHIRKMKEELPLLGARLVDRTAIFSNGSYIDCGHMADEEAIGRYLSTGYGVIAPDEASLYPSGTDGVPVIAELSTRARESWPTLTGQPSVPLFIPVTNPGGPSAHWLLDMFIDQEPDTDLFPALAGTHPDGSPVYNTAHWQYQAARLDDNPYMREDYATTDLAVLSKWRYDQLRHGNWHVFQGQFFGQWREAIHVADLGTPRDVTWFRSLDWGFNAPGCVLWWAVLPDHRLYIRAELKFQYMDEPDVATAVKKIDKELGIKKVAYTAADPSIFYHTGATHRGIDGFVGKSIAETLGYYGVQCVPADNDRRNGWKRVHAILRIAPDGKPWCQINPDCRYLVRSMASAKSDKHDPDDVDTKSDDHALDSCRYGAHSRPGFSASTTRSVPASGSIADLRQRFQKRVGLLGRPSYV